MVMTVGEEGQQKIEEKEFEKFIRKCMDKEGPMGNHGTYVQTHWSLAAAERRQKIRLSLATRAAGSLLFSLVCFDNRE